ncbi:MAG: hypothetical protein PW845_04465 [Pseudomonas sp.]|uniref:hypothetical protein n=1 Tax=Pseudomonas abieticivorans TaxID=2931382 RepID=UPI0020BE5BA0|nr:hypothetical protein [Pseudomonas sp. PIA16]MDE1164639.1 hypothetical protein [Pseudomonas sp.]
MSACNLPLSSRFKAPLLACCLGEVIVDVSGPLWDRDVRTIDGRKLKGIVIKYQ